MTWSFKVCLFMVTILHSSPRSGGSDSTKIASELLPIENNLAECLVYVIQDPGLTITINIQISNQTESKSTKQQFEEIVDKFGILNDKAVLHLYSDDSESYNIHGRFFFIDSLRSLEYLIEHQRKQEKDSSGQRQYYYITLPVNVPNEEEILEQIFDFCANNFIINVIVLVDQMADGIVTLYTYYPFTETTCSGRTPTVLNRFVNGSFEWNRPIFPQKTKNLWQCPLTVILWHQAPFVRANGDQFTGLEVNIFNALAKAMNFSLQVKLPYNVSIESHSDHAIDAFKMIDNGQGNFSIRACVSKFNQNYATTEAYMGSNVRIICKRPKAYSPLEILLFPFDWSTWACILIIFIGKRIGQFLGRRFANNLVPRRIHSTRLYIMTWLLSILIIRSSYEGSIFNFLRNRPSKSVPNNLNEAIDQGYKFIIQISSYKLYHDIPELKNNLISFSGSIPDMFDYFDQLDRSKYAVIVPDYYLSLFNYDSARYREYFIVPEPFSFVYLCVYLPKFSYLTEEFNRQFQKSHASGYLNKHYQLSVVIDNFKKKKTSDSGPMRMSLHQIMGALELLAILVGISALIFVMEVLSRRNHRLRMIMEYFQ